MGLYELSILCLLVTQGWMQTADPTDWNSFYVNFYTNIEMPKTEEAAKRGKFELVDPWNYEGSSDFSGKVNLYCLPNDPRVCVMFTKSQYIIKELTEKRADLFDHFNYSEISMFKESDMFGLPAFVAEIMFIDPVSIQYLNIEQSNETADGIWYKIDHKWQKMEREESNAVFVKQNCIPGMGFHYYYNMRRNLDCRVKVYPGFLLYYKNKLIGAGIMTFGTFSNNTQWFEEYPVPTVKLTIPDGPECLTELRRAYGSTNLHIYFIEKPREISCDCLESPVY